jgi:hypothetical protein
LSWNLITFGDDRFLQLVYTARHVLRTLSSPPKSHSTTEQRCKRMLRALTAKMDEADVGKNIVDDHEESEEEEEVGRWNVKLSLSK